VGRYLRRLIGNQTLPEGECVFLEVSDTGSGIPEATAMPVMDGPEAFARIRSVRPDIPIVVTSGYAESDAATRFGPDQPSGFLNKPYTAAQCAEAFMAALELPSPPTGSTP